MAAWRAPEGVPVPITGFTTRGGLRSILPVQAFLEDLPGRACRHWGTIPGPRVSQCLLHVLGPSPDNLEE